MNPERWALVREIFLLAIDEAPARRDEVLRERCGDDAELRAEVEKLLRGHRTSEEAESGSGPRPDVRIDPPAERTTPRRLGDFELLEEIGSGGMGVVYRARQASLDRVVAVKVLRHPFGLSAGRLREFRGEPEKAARLRHPNIVPIHLMGEEGGLPFFVMDHVRGRSLREILEEARHARAMGAGFLLPSPLGRQGASYAARVAETIAKVADALEYSHRQGIVHRDVKPGNLLIDEQGEPHLVDFGIAKRLDAESVTSRVIGTPYYMSPEQARLHSIKVDHRTDIYSLGVVLYELLTLHRPFEGETYTQVFLAIRQVEPAPVRRRNPEVPKDLETICHKAMRKDPAERYATAGELAADLRRFLALRAPLARPPSLLQRVTGLARRRALLASVLLTSLVVGTLVWRTTSMLAERGRLRADLDTLLTRGELAEIRYSPQEEQAEEALRRLEAGSLALRRLRGTYPSLPDDAEQVAGACERELQACALGLARDSAQAMVARAQESFTADGTIDLAQVSRHMAHAMRLGALLGDEGREELETLLGDLRPRLTLRSDPPGAVVRLLRLDPLTDLPLVEEAARELGRTPLELEPVDLGAYRVLLEGVDGTGELTVFLGEYGRDLVLPTVRLLPTDEVTADMVPIPAGELLLEGVDFPGEQPIAHGAFWIDRHEVTNAEYARFCRETGHPAPYRWPSNWRESWERGWDRLPVVWVDLADAEAYAAWAGKRLPVLFEWQRAARGPLANRFPWDSEDVDAATVRARARVDQRLAREGVVADEIGPSWEEYLGLVVPVESFLDDRSPEGVYDVLGNVTEWTVSPVLLREQDGRRLRVLTTRVGGGRSWCFPPEPLSVVTRLGSADRSACIGFRCVKSQP